MDDDHEITKEEANLIIAKGLWGDENIGVYCGKVRILDGLNSVDCCQTFNIFYTDFSGAWMAIKKWKSMNAKRCASIDCVLDRFVVSLEVGDQYDHVAQGCGADEDECMAVAKAILSTIVGYPPPEIKRY